MAKEKKSFFGKLMGGEEQQYQQPVQQVAVVEEQSAQPEIEVQVEEIEAVPEVADEQPGAKPESEEWLSEYEGELNIDMYQTRDNVIIKSTIAGVKGDDLDITIANDMLTIRGDRKREEKIEAEDYFYQECYWGGFSRSVILPVDVDTEHIEADLRDGILTVILPKAAKARTKKIKVKGI
jgi:HSP20 family protein